MDAYEAIMTRRSIRAYTPQPVPDDLIEQIVAAAMNAPSAGNQQPWQFVVITERKQLEALAAIMPYGQMLKEAPLGIVVCGDVDLEQNKGYWVQDCSAATQNLLLAAHASGLGAVWLGVYPRDERVASVRQLLGLPVHVIPLCAIAAGYPREGKAPERRYKQARVHRNQW